MLRFIFSTIFGCLFLIGSAQEPVSTFSEPFDEPEAVNYKVLQCPNGNTFLLSFMSKAGITVAVYDNSHKRIAMQILTGSDATWKPEDMIGNPYSGLDRMSKVCAAYSTSDEVVIFMEQVSDNAPNLNRIRLSCTDGKLLTEERIATISPYSRGDALAVGFGRAKAKAFYVKRDKISCAYAVAAYDGLSTGAQRLRFIHYNARHEEIERGDYSTAEQGYQQSDYLDMIVNGTDNVLIAAYCHNEDENGDAKILLSTFQDNKFTHHPLNVTKGLRNTKAVLISNPITKNLELYTLSDVKTSTKLLGSKIEVAMEQKLITIVPATFEVLSNKTPSTQLMNEYRKTRWDIATEHFAGIPMNMVVNVDGTVTLLYQEELLAVPAKFNAYLSDAPATGGCMLYDIGITDWDEQKGEQTRYVARNEQPSNYVALPFSEAGIHDGRVVFSYGMRKAVDDGYNDGFHVFDYLSTTTGRYCIFNTEPENFEQDADKAPKRMVDIQTANTVCYKLTGGEMTKFYFFGTPDNSFSNRFALITSGDYNEATETYAVMIIEKKGRKDKSARIAWVHI